VIITTNLLRKTIILAILRENRPLKKKTQLKQKKKAISPTEINKKSAERASCEANKSTSNSSRKKIDKFSVRVFLIN